MKIVRIILVALAAAGLAWLSIAVSYANYYGKRDPAAALAMFPADARARANEAEAELGNLKGEESELGELTERARSVIERDPTVIDAWRLIGSIASMRGQDDSASGIMRFAERLSRRDLRTQLWLMNESGRRGRLDELIAHADIALRISPANSAMLSAAMIEASASPPIARRLVSVLAADPRWERDFSYQLAHSMAPGDRVAALVAPLADDEEERAIMIPIVQRLVTQRDYSNAWNVYRLLKQQPSASAGEVRDGGFDDTSVPIAPFDWTLGDTGRVRGERRASPAGGVALFIRAEPGARGSAATQLVVMAPGSYSLRFQAGQGEDTNSGAIEWRVACANAPERIVGQGRLVPAAPGGSRFSQNVTIPAGCAAQLLSFEARGGSGIGASESWIDDVALVRQ
jgi:hypothetical protein